MRCEVCGRAEEAAGVMASTDITETESLHVCEACRQDRQTHLKDDGEGTEQE